MSRRQFAAWGATFIIWTLTVATHLLHRHADEVLLNLLLWAAGVATLITVALVCYEGLREGQRRLMERMEERHTEQAEATHEEIRRIRKKLGDLVAEGAAREKRLDEVAETLNDLTLLLEQLLDPHTRASVTNLRDRPHSG